VLAGCWCPRRCHCPPHSTTEGRGARASKAMVRRWPPARSPALIEDLSGRGQGSGQGVDWGPEWLAARRRHSLAHRQGFLPEGAVGGSGPLPGLRIPGQTGLTASRSASASAGGRLSLSLVLKAAGGWFRRGWSPGLKAAPNRHRGRRAGHAPGWCSSRSARRAQPQARSWSAWAASSPSRAARRHRWPSSSAELQGFGGQLHQGGHGQGDALGVAGRFAPPPAVAGDADQQAAGVGIPVGRSPAFEKAVTSIRALCGGAVAASASLGGTLDTAQPSRSTGLAVPALSTPALRQ